jgi:preprotein translocase subunit YajC
MFTTPAFAQGLGGADSGMLVQLLPFLFIFVIIYILIIRPQQKRAKQHKDMISAVRRGDTIVTSGGLIGKVTKVTEGNDEIQVELAKDVKVRVMRHMISDVSSKNEPVANKK